MRLSGQGLAFAPAVLQKASQLKGKCQDEDLSRQWALVSQGLAGLGCRKSWVKFLYSSFKFACMDCGMRGVWFTIRFA